MSDQSNVITQNSISQSAQQSSPSAGAIYRHPAGNARAATRSGNQHNTAIAQRPQSRNPNPINYYTTQSRTTVNSNLPSFLLRQMGANASSSVSRILSNQNGFSGVSSQSQPSYQFYTNSSSQQPPSVHPQFRSKVVCRLNCKYCSKTVCRRGMKAILLADANVELFSTDAPPKG
jgi:hypothetical protein